MVLRFGSVDRFSEPASRQHPERRTTLKFHADRDNLATLLIAAFGFYELFVDRMAARGHGRLPEWLEMRDLNDLKARVISMIVLITAVDFVEVLVDSSGALYILERGVPLVVGALTAYVRLGRNVHDDGGRRPAQLRGAEMEGPIATARYRGPR